MLKDERLRTTNASMAPITPGTSPNHPNNFLDSIGKYNDSNNDNLNFRRQTNSPRQAELPAEVYGAYDIPPQERTSHFKRL